MGLRPEEGRPQPGRQGLDRAEQFVGAPAVVELERGLDAPHDPLLDALLAIAELERDARRDEAGVERLRVPPGIEQDGGARAGDAGPRLKLGRLLALEPWGEHRLRLLRPPLVQVDLA